MVCNSDFHIEMEHRRNYIISHMFYVNVLQITEIELYYV